MTTYQYSDSIWLESVEQLELSLPLSVEEKAFFAGVNFTKSFTYSDTHLWTMYRRWKQQQEAPSEQNDRL